MEQPRTLKHYEILSRLGEGGMGVVYRARDTRLGREVALKMLPEELARNEERSQRFEREARIVSGLSHPGIATLYDFDRDGDTAFLTMELVKGSNLREALKQGPLPLSRLLECGIQVSEALSAAHRGGVVHRDLKPENIMAAESGYYKVLDFGVARIEDPAANVGPVSTRTPTRTWATRAGSLIGTVAYMSPEQVLGQPVDARSDIFSLGSVLYELATGRTPFQGNSDIATAHAIAYEPVESVASHRSEVPEGLDMVVAKCLAKSRDQRYQRTEDLVQDLKTLRTNTLSGARDARNLLAYDGAASGRKRWLAPVLVTLLVLAVGAPVGLWLTRNGGDPARLGPPRTPVDVRPTLTTPAAQTNARPRLVVGFFENNTGQSETAWISRGLPEMLTTDLSRSARLDVIATQRLHDLLASAGRDASQGLDRSTTAELARWAGADIVISGSVFQAGDQYRIDAQAYDTTDGTVLTAYKAVGTELFSLVTELTNGLLEGLQVGAGDGQRLETVTTASEEALQAFLNGKQHYEGLRLGEAAEELGKSIEVDPDFALARLQLAKTLLVAGQVDEAVPLLERAVEQAAGMPEGEGLLAQALLAFYAEEDLEGGAAHLEGLLEKFPQNGEAYTWWGRALLRLTGKPMKATKMLRRALEQDPNNLLAVAAMADQLVGLGDNETAKLILQETIERNPQAEAALQRLIDSY